MALLRCAAACFFKRGEDLFKGFLNVCLVEGEEEGNSCLTSGL